MKLLSATFSATAVVLAALGTANAQSPCSSIYTRKELLSLSSSEWGTVSSVLSNMQRDGWFAWFGYLHNTYFNQIHGNSQFFPFHRRFVQDWESVGQRYNSGFIQPYWDEMRDYRTPASSQVLTSAWVGGNGQGSNWCVTNGNQAGWTMTYPSNHCFSRNFGNNGNPTSWYSPEYIQSFIQRDTSMAQFRSDIEYSLHGVVHINIGGEMYQGYSPNDWIFMLHHANLDRLWWQWQKNNQLWTMDGPNYDGSQISLSSNIAAYNEPISSVMQLGYGNMCFQYASDPISSSLTRRGLASSVEKNLVSTLPDDVLAQWFPQTAKAKPEIAEIASAPSFAAPNLKAIPQPAKLTQKWIDMHHFDPAAVAKVENDATAFVNAMNKAGYKSPL